VTRKIDHYELRHVPAHLLRRCHQRATDLYTAEVGDNGLTPRQFVVLLTVHQNPGLNQTDLASLTGIDRSTVADMVARLVRRGFLRHRRPVHDRRSKVLSLTDSGVASLRRDFDAVRRAQEQLMAPVPNHMRDQFIDCLRLMAEQGDGDILVDPARSGIAAE